jgi:hypothetical protein
VAELAAGTVRASSLVENLNSRLRSYFFLRRHLGPDYLALLQFFLNHRRLERSDRPERVGKTPAELLRDRKQITCSILCRSNGVVPIAVEVVRS